MSSDTILDARDITVRFGGLVAVDSVSVAFQQVASVVVPRA